MSVRLMTRNIGAGSRAEETRLFAEQIADFMARRRFLFRIKRSTA